MTPLIIFALDRPNQRNIPAATKRSHVEYLIDTSERIVMAGPLCIMPTNSRSSSYRSTPTAEGALQPALTLSSVILFLCR